MNTIKRPILEVSNARSASIKINNHEDRALDKNLVRPEVMREVFISMFPAAKGKI
jgi:hypothetical protein